MPLSVEFPRVHIYKSPAEYYEATEGVVDRGRVFLNVLKSRFSLIKENCENLTFCTMIHPVGGNI